MSFWQKVVNIGTSETRHDAFPYTQPITIIVTGNSGDIEISTSTGTDIEVTLHSHGINAAKQLADMQVRYDSELHRLEVSAPEAKWTVLTAIDVTISAPAYTSITTTTAAGDIDIAATATTSAAFFINGREASGSSFQPDGASFVSGDTAAGRVRNLATRASPSTI